MQPSLTTPCTFSTAAQPPRKSQDIARSRRRSPAIRSSEVFTTPTLTIVRYNSTVQSPTGPGPSTSGTDAAAFTMPQDRLDWNTFFKLKKSRRRIQLVSSVGTGIAGMGGGMQALVMSDMDAIVGQLPLDPFISLGLISFACGGMGWLMGPIVGTGIFNMMNRKYISQMATVRLLSFPQQSQKLTFKQKEKEFYSRIKKYRVDPSASSMANPVPDYYGERISSVQGYRQWLKDQRAFNKKRQTFVS